MDIIEAFNFALEESRQQERVVKSNLEVLLCHMLKCKYQNDYPTKVSWRKSIKSSFKDMVFEFKGVGKGSLYKSFYLKNLDLEYIYKLAVRDAVEETGLEIQHFPSACEWTKEQLTDVDFIYNFISEWGQDDSSYK